ncbi:hypothetical protein BJX68DRAFT_268590 [Aspergillus pseudodeflectus]|uniref:Uncharacterized protein n=1 Tax=Aspergillus pseudodeflectus TaxID=176178 RepID=A0ABR4K2I2_9EURO
MADNEVPPTVEDTIHIFEETGSGWNHRGSELAIDEPTANFAIFCTNHFDKVRLDYKDWFQPAFWSVIDKDLNGTFHCQYDYMGERVTPKVSWTCFKLKRVHSANVYNWKQPSLHVTWDHQTRRQLVYLFDFLPPTNQNEEQKEFLSTLPSPEARQNNPFAWHAAFSRVVLEQYDEAYWLVRDRVRDHEKNRRFNVNSKDFFPELHDIARHAFHYSEIIEVAENTLNRLVQEQIRWREEDGAAIHDGGIGYWLDPHQELLLQQKAAYALKARSKSLNERLLNEINLGFNLVLQADSAWMKTIAFVSMVYLPGTFVSGLFGTNFFDFDSPTPGLWAHSNFWLYWAVAVPLTMATMGIWAAWHRRTDIQQRWDSSYSSMQRKLLMRSLAKQNMGNADSALHKSGTELSILGLVRAATTMNRRNVRRKETV